MKRKYHEPVLAFMFLVASAGAYGQADSSQQAAVKPKFKLGVYYNTRKQMPFWRS